MAGSVGADCRPKPERGHKEVRGTPRLHMPTDQSDGMQVLSPRQRFGQTPSPLFWRKAESTGELFSGMDP